MWVCDCVRVSELKQCGIVNEIMWMYILTLGGSMQGQEAYFYIVKTSFKQ